MERFTLTFSSLESLDREVDDNLRRRRAFVPGVVASAERRACTVVLVHPVFGHELELAAEVVFVAADGPGAGVGLAITAVELEPQLDAFVALREAAEEPPVLLDLDPVGECEVEPGPADGASVPLSGAPGAERLPNVHERVRKLAPHERDKLARSGNLTERTALERAFGGAVWEALLANPQLTGPEVARIAKNGTVPAPLLNTITANAGWLARSEVRRALLANARLGTVAIERVLRATPQAELRLVASQTAYPARVRMAARKIVPG